MDEIVKKFLLKDKENICSFYNIVFIEEKYVYSLKIIFSMNVNYFIDLISKVFHDKIIIFTKFQYDDTNFYFYDYIKKFNYESKSHYLNTNDFKDKLFYIQRHFSKLKEYHIMYQQYEQAAKYRDVQKFFLDLVNEKPQIKY